MNLVAVVIALLFLLALLVAVLLGTPEQQQIVIECINEILGTISSSS
ncbi:hypothetical protein [Alteribacillus bidgolensis]|uniref:Uncharacterized protein n=1 Tax=Alteribacillus bidgolensis TaxID=930129 RepID=A0A1G8PLP7_9BACI|nr:hypothetical protein [Alteribacillus bidgolensis]SDI93461.1 hypothetical protein SAMN05216352_11532 [Alteribacillus bidgolensis]